MILAVIVYTAIILFSDAREVGKAVSGISAGWIPLFLSLSILNYLLRFLKWHYFLGRVNVRIPLRESFSVFIAGFSMTITPGKLGELLKCYLLRESRGIPVSVTSPVIVAERVTDLLSMVLIAVSSLLVVDHGGALIAVGAGIVFVAAVMMMLLSSRAFCFFTGFLCRIGPLQKHRENFNSFQRNCSTLLDLKSLVVAVPIGILSWGSEALILCLVSVSLGVDPSLPLGLALLAHSAGTIAGAVSMIPGGLGLTEITIGAILVGAMPEADAAAATLIMRFSTIWFAVVLGLVMLGILKKKQ